MRTFSTGAFGLFSGHIIPLCALFLGAIIAIVVVTVFRNRIEAGRKISPWKVSGHIAINIVIAATVVVACVRIFDYLLVREIKPSISKITIDNRTRHVIAVAVPSETTFTVAGSKESILYSGIGVGSELFQAIPAPLLFDISLSSPEHEPQQWINERLDTSSGGGWREASADLSVFDGSPLEIKVTSKYVDSFSFLRSASLLKYYFNLIFLKDFRFDIRHRVGFLVVPAVFKRFDPDNKNVILVAIDTLRADHVSFCGYPHMTTPNIDGLAAQGFSFSNCQSTAPWTLPSFFSMLTSTYPSVHTYGTNFHGIFRPELGLANIWTVGTISPDYSIETLGEILRSKNFYTTAFVNNPFLTTEHEMERGFIEYNQYKNTAEDGMEYILPWLDSHRDSRFFLFFHIMDPHDIPADCDMEADTKIPSGDTDKDKHQTAIDCYDKIIRSSDRQIGRMMEHLKNLGLEENTLVVITSDHGQEFLDHGGVGHGQSLYDELLRVPLVFYLPGKFREKGTSPERVSTVDIAPTVLSILDLPVPSYFQGQNLMPLADGKPISAQPLFAEAVGSGHEKKAVYLDGFKLIYTATANEFELYNLKEDPGEMSNVLHNFPDIARDMKLLLLRHIDRTRKGFHIVLKPPEGQELFEGKLVTAGTFMEVMPFDLTNSKVFEVNRHAKEIFFRFWGSSNIDGISFKVDPPEATIQLTITKDKDRNLAMIYPDSTSGGRHSGPLEFDRQTIREVSTPPNVSEYEAGLHLYFCKGKEESRHVRIGEKTKEELQALGYLR